MALTQQDLQALKAGIRQEKVNKTLFNIKEQEFLDESNVLKTRTVVEIQKPGNKHPVTRLLDFDLMMKATHEENDQIADYFIQRFVALKEDQIEHDDKDIISALINRGLLTWAILSQYDLTKINLLIDSYCNENVYRKVKVALPSLLEVAKQKHGVIKEQVRIDTDIIKANQAKEKLLDEKLAKVIELEAKLELKLKTLNK